MSNPDQDATSDKSDTSLINWSKDYKKKGLGSALANLANYITVESGLITSKNYTQELPKWKADILKTAESK